MDVTAADILATRAYIRETPTGWLAVSGPGSVLRIGVVGETENDARQKFERALEAWAELRDRSLPPALA